MKKIVISFTAIFTFIFLVSCQTVTNKIDEKTALEEKELSKWLNKSETELKTVFGKPDKIEFINSRNRFYIYHSEKLKINVKENLRLILKT